MFPLAFVIALGWLAGKSRILDASQNGFLAGLVVQFLLPSALFVGAARTSPAEIENWGILLGLALGFVVIYLLVLFLAVAIYLYDFSDGALRALNCSLPNMAVMGIPILGDVVGPSNPLSVQIGNLVSSLVLVPVTLTFLEGGKQRQRGGRVFWQSLFGSVRQPLVWAPVAGLVMAFVGVRLPEAANRVFKTSHEIGYEWHVRHQAAFQRSTDNGVSKTINLPNDASEEDVANAYRLAWELGCLGITVFRDGCKGEQVLHVGIKDKPAAAPAASGPVVVKPRPHSLSGRTYRSETPIGTAFITVNETGDAEPFEVFVQVGKGGSDTMAVAEALGRLISLTLRLPSPMSPQRRLEEVISQLSRIGGAQPLGFGKGKVLSLPDALARTLAEHTGQLKPSSEAPPGARGNDQRRIGDLCKECGQATFVYEEGCKKCLSCGYNEC
jgi:hypothetical protein